MKIHPVVGAEILERVAFPYPVVPIVRCASREMGRTRLSVRLERRGDSHRRAHSGGRGLPGRAGFRPPIPAGHASRRGHGGSRGAGRARASIPTWWTCLKRRYVELERMAPSDSRWLPTRLSTGSQDRARRGAGRRLSRTPRPHLRGRTRVRFLGFHRGGPPGSADAVRTDAGIGQFAEPRRNPFRGVGARLKRIVPLRRHRGLCPPRRPS